MFCKSCGKKIGDDCSFCIFCGHQASQSKGQIHKSKILELISNFPYNNLAELKKNIRENKVIVRLRMDIAREWLMGGKDSPAWERNSSYTLATILYFIYPIFLIIFPFFIHSYWLILLVIPYYFSVFIMTPIARKTCIIFSIFIPVSLVLATYGLFYAKDKTVLLLLASLIVVPWLIYRYIYGVAIDCATRAILDDEDLFLAFVSVRAVMLDDLTNKKELWLEIKENNAL